MTIDKPYYSRNPGMPSAHWLVFNMHDSDKRNAKKVFIGRFSKEDYNRIIKPIEKAGIMSIFHSKQTQYTMAYVNAVAASVDERFKDEWVKCDQCDEWAIAGTGHCLQHQPKPC